VSVPRAYEAVLLRCLDQADKRYSTARDLVNDVRALRQGESPAVGPADLNDDQARLLGVVVGACPTTLDSASFYVIEQEIGGRQSRLRTSLALSALLKRKFLEQNIDEDQDGNRFNVFRPLPEGTDWAERNVARIDELDRATPASAAAADSDVPF
jgi:hypothetical protein